MRNVPNNLIALINNHENPNKHNSPNNPNGSTNQ